jgi:hypothetical protein
MFESFVCGFFFLSLFGFSLEVEEDTLICLFFVVLVSGFVSLLMEEEIDGGHFLLSWRSDEMRKEGSA